jgi:adenylate kinase family enzyme
MSYRIAIIGTSGSGKTTLAQQAAQILHIPHVELDALFWKPNWQPSETWEFYDRVESATVGDAWVVDGNYLRARLVVWERATTVVWLNYALPLILWRVTRRTITRSLFQEELWNGCRETLQKGFLSSDSIILWALRSHRLNQRRTLEWLAMPQYRHLGVVELTSPAEADAWLASLGSRIN